jgi:hypothetical protein
MSEEEIIATRPPNENENLLQKKFYEDFAAQAERVDKLSAQLLSMELAIPGIYATVLKLIAGEDGVLRNLPVIQWTFALWGIALLLTIGGMIPKEYNVNPKILKQPKEQEGDEDPDREIGIEEYFIKSASYKRSFVIASSIFFFLGIMVAAFTIGQ